MVDATDLKSVARKGRAGSSPAGATIIRIDSGFFCAGCKITANVCTEAAPIIKYMVGWHVDRIKKYARNRGWLIQIGRDRNGNQ